MTARIVPRPKKDDSPLALPPVAEIKPLPEPQVLAYATLNDIYVLFGPGAKKSVQIAERPECIHTLALYRGRLVDASGRNIRYTDSGELINQRPSHIEALAVHNGELVDAGDYRQIFYTETDELINWRDKYLSALFVHNGELVDICDGHIRYTESDKLIRRRPEGAGALAIHNGRLVDGGHDGRILYTETDELIKRRFISPRSRRPNAVGNLAVLGGRLIDASGCDIRYTDTSKLIVTSSSGMVTGLCPIPLSLAERLIQGRSLK